MTTQSSVTRSKTMGLVALTIVSIVTIGSATGHDTVSHDRHDHAVNIDHDHRYRNSLVGTWLLDVNVPIEGIPSIQALATFHADGTLHVSQTGIHENSAALDRFCGCNGGNAHGAWRRVGVNRYSFAFTYFLFSGPNTGSLDLNLSLPLESEGQHIGYGVVDEAIVRVVGNRLSGGNRGTGTNLDGDALNPQIPPIRQSFAGRRLVLNRLGRGMSLSP